MGAVRVIRRTLAFLCFCLFASSIVVYSQKVYAVGDVPNVHLQDARLYTSDPAGLISSQERQSIDSLARRIERERGVQTALVVLPSVGDRDVESFANELFRLWGIGDKRTDRGLLILYVDDQKRVRSEVGYGLEGVLTDALMGRLQRENMNPRFKQDRVGEGLLAGMLALESQLSSGSLDSPDGRSFSPQEDGISWSSILLFWALFSSVVLYFAYAPLRGRLQRVSTPSQARAELPSLEGDAGTLLSITGLVCLPLLPFVYLWWRGRKRSLEALSAICPTCGGHMHHRQVGGETLHLLTLAQQMETRLGSRVYYLYECADCGATELTFTSGVRAGHYTICPICKAQAVASQRVGRISPRVVRYRRRCQCCGWSEGHDKQERDQDSDLATALILGSLLRGSGRGGFSSGGGFSGGSWGGGSSGGGGATSGW